ncbi:unnamed protein product [Mesocestoides corti]|uniref:COesterase domain-containing protein n=1 Tax=Mesocestoides corti TaxID=53468 RepID=A0A0R3UQQ5_MESCO|nr:unnamed protein product [Mesocestoides corti]
MGQPKTTLILAEFHSVSELANEVSHVPFHFDNDFAIDQLWSTIPKRTQLTTSELVNQFLSRDDLGDLEPIQILRKMRQLSYDDPLEDGWPVNAQVYRLSSTRYSTAEQELGNMLQLGIVRRSDSDWSSALYMVFKTVVSEWWPCDDYRALNAITNPDGYQISDLHDMFRFYTENPLFSAKYNKPQKRYSTFGHDLLAIYPAVKHIRTSNVFVSGVVIFTNTVHNQKWVFSGHPKFTFPLHKYPLSGRNGFSGDPAVSTTASSSAAGGGLSATRLSDRLQGSLQIPF